MKQKKSTKVLCKFEKILKILMDEYDVILLKGEDDKVNVFRHGLDYITSFNIIKDGDFYKYKYNGETYNAFSKMLKQAEEDNKKKPFPSYVYCPITREPYKILRYVRDYMELIGFSIPRYGEKFFCTHNGHGESFVMKNIYGEPISHIEVITDDWENGTSGKAIRSIGDGWSWCEVKFKGFEDVLGVINSLLEPEILVNAAKYIATSSNMSAERKDDVQGVTITPELNIVKQDMKKQTTHLLEKALERLKSEC